MKRSRRACRCSSNCWRIAQVKKTEQDDLIKSYQLATAGKNDRNFVGSFAKHLEDCHELFLRVPGEGRWGDPARIWPGGNPWVREKAELPELVADWCEHLEAEGFGKGVHKAFCGIADHLMSWMPGKDLFGKSKTMLIRAFEGLGAMLLGDWEFNYGNAKAMNRPSVAFGHKLARCPALLHRLGVGGAAGSHAGHPRAA